MRNQCDTSSITPMYFSHFGPIMPQEVIDFDPHWVRQWLFSLVVLCHHRNHCLLIISMVYLISPCGFMRSPDPYSSGLLRWCWGDHKHWWSTLKDMGGIDCSTNYCYHSTTELEYHQISNIRRIKSQNFKNEDVVGAAPTGDAPTTSEWLTI